MWRSIHQTFKSRTLWEQNGTLLCVGPCDFEEFQVDSLTTKSFLLVNWSLCKRNSSIIWNEKQIKKPFFEKKTMFLCRFYRRRMCFNKISMWHPTIFLSTFPNLLWMHWKDEACFSIFWFYWWAVTLHPLWAFHPFPWLHKGCRKVFGYYLRWNTGCSTWKNMIKANISVTFWDSKTPAKKYEKLESLVF